MSYDENCNAKFTKADMPTHLDPDGMVAWDLQMHAGDANRHSSGDGTAKPEAQQASDKAFTATKSALAESGVAKFIGSHDKAAELHRDAQQAHTDALNLHENPSARLSHAKAASIHSQFAAHHGTIANADDDGDEDGPDTDNDGD